MSKRLSILYSPLFLLGIVVLIVNDHWLKFSYPGFITGKLSDIAGLFVFPLFFAAFLPRHRKIIYILIAIGFIFWKSPSSQFLIDWWNLYFMAVDRVVDLTDLVALLILPLSYIYMEKHRVPSVTFNPTPIILISSVAFIATSRAPNRSIEMNREFSMQIPIDTLEYRMFFHPNITNNTVARAEWHHLDSLERSKRTYLPKYTNRRKKDLVKKYGSHRIYFEIEDSAHECVNHYVNVKLVKNRKISKIVLERSSYYHCNHSSSVLDDKDLLAGHFEKMIVQPISY